MKGRMLLEEVLNSPFEDVREEMVSFILANGVKHICDLNTPGIWHTYSVLGFGIS